MNPTLITRRGRSSEFKSADVSFVKVGSDTAVLFMVVNGTTATCVSRNGVAFRKQTTSLVASMPAPHSAQFDALLNITQTSAKK